MKGGDKMRNAEEIKKEMGIEDLLINTPVHVQKLLIEVLLDMRDLMVETTYKKHIKTTKVKDSDIEVGIERDCNLIYNQPFHPATGFECNEPSYYLKIFDIKIPISAEQYKGFCEEQRRRFKKCTQ